MPLTLARPGQQVTIRRVMGKDEVRAHLAELGFVAETVVTVLGALAGGVIVQVKDSRVALDADLASRIFV